jgi:hypothetical protein
MFLRASVKELLSVGMGEVGLSAGEVAVSSVGVPVGMGEGDVPVLQAAKSNNNANIQ